MSPGDKLGRCLEADDDALDRYADFLKSCAGCGYQRAQALVLDCANGAAYRIAEKVYSELGADITVIGNEPNGVNINDACGSTHPEKLQEEVWNTTGAFLGMAYDGDADRLIAVDEKGRIIDGAISLPVRLRTDDEGSRRASGRSGDSYSHERCRGSINM